MVLKVHIFLPNYDWYSSCRFFWYYVRISLKGIFACFLKYTTFFCLVHAVHFLFFCVILLSLHVCSFGCFLLWRVSSKANFGYYSYLLWCSRMPISKFIFSELVQFNGRSTCQYCTLKYTKRYQKFRKKNHFSKCFFLFSFSPKVPPFTKNYHLHVVSFEK